MEDAMLGIDVSKATLAYCLLDGTTQQVVTTGQVPNTTAGISALLSMATPTCPWVAEPTGSYSTALITQAQAAGRTVLQAPPRQAKAFLRAVSPRAKSDRLDSIGLARYACAVPLQPFPVKSEAVVQLEHALAARRGLSDSIAHLTQQRQVLPHAAPVLAAAIAALEEQRKVLDRQIATLTEQESLLVARTLRGIPGIGPVTSAALAACFASHTFAHPDQFVAYLGLDVRVSDSGQQTGIRQLSRRGHPELRRLLYLCAQANVRARDAENPFQQQYHRERAKGLSTTAALNAVARKLARTCWSLVTHGTTYDPARVHQQPSRERRALDTQP
jgi:transposase